MAAWSAQPRETASSVLSVVLRSFWNTFVRMFLMAGTRLEPPTTSTKSMSSTVNLPSISVFSVSSSWLAVSSMRLSWGAAISSKSARIMSPWTSTSFIRHSMPILHLVELALISFLIFSHSTIRRMAARGCSLTSTLYFALNSAAKWANSRSSKSEPPTAA